MRAFTVCLTLAFATLSMACLAGKKKPTEPGAVTKKTWTREEFKTAVIGKTPDEVISAVGKPDRTSGSQSEDWFYFDRTVDAITGKNDNTAMVVFEGGVAARVVY